MRNLPYCCCLLTSASGKTLLFLIILIFCSTQFCCKICVNIFATVSQSLRNMECLSTSSLSSSKYLWSIRHTPRWLIYIYFLSDLRVRESFQFIQSFGPSNTAIMAQHTIDQYTCKPATINLWSNLKGMLRARPKWLNLVESCQQYSISYKEKCNSDIRVMLQKPLMKSYNPCIVPPSFRDCLPGSSWWVISTFVAHKPECTITLEGRIVGGCSFASWHHHCIEFRKQVVSVYSHHSSHKEWESKGGKFVGNSKKWQLWTKYSCISP